MRILFPVPTLVPAAVGCLLATLPSVWGAENLALNQPVFSSGANWGEFKPAALTDGDPLTFTHPLADTGSLGFYYQVDLGREAKLDRILLRNRGDGCCPERLSNYRVEVYADRGGSPGTVNWSANIHVNNSNSGVGGIDTITGDLNGAALFAGRFVRIVNSSGDAYNPQLAEIEVYGGATPIVRVFSADDDVITTGSSTALRWEIANATTAQISSGVGAVNATNGTVTVSPATTTTYTLTAGNESGTVSATLILGVNVTLLHPQLGEFLADNSGGLNDDDGDASDWIELHNPNPFSRSVGGYFLTDDPEDLKKWPLPNARLAAGGSLVVFASGKDRRDPLAPLHTNFRIAADGDYLALADRDGKTILQQFPADYPITKKFPKQRENISYGLGANGVTGYFRPSTPGATNGAAFAGVVADTQFSHDRGFYDTNLTVTITTATPGATIRYTLDRTEPTATKGTIYAAPVPITKTTVLRAAAFRDGWAPTDVDTQTYVFPTNVITSSVMRTAITQNPAYQPQMRAALLDVPSISLVTPGTINNNSEVKTSVEWINPDGTPGVQEDCGVSLFGGAFTDFAKKNFRLYFKAEFGATKFRYPAFVGFERGLAAADEFDHLELRSGSHDMSMRGFYMSNICADDTMLDLGQLNPHGRFVHLYLNGTYWGVYHLRERWSAAMHASYLGGSKTNYEAINGNWNVGGWPDPGVPFDGDGSAWKRVKSLRSKYTEVKPWLDVPQYLDFMLTWIYGRCEDEYRCVGPTVPGSGFKFYLNDADGFFYSPANGWYGEPSNRTAHGNGGRQPGDGPGGLLSALHTAGHPDYRTLLADRIHSALFHEGALTPARMTARLTNRCAEMQRPFLAEAARWNFRTPANWLSVRDDIVNNWLPTRTAAVITQLRSAGYYPALNAPTLSRQGGLVASGFAVGFTGPNSGTIHYTLDGSDPRLPGGAVAPGARSFVTGGSSETPVPSGSKWRWFTSVAGLGASDIVEGQASWSAANWKHPDFNDGAWLEGPAQLGYGENDEATVIPFGGNSGAKWISSYFRHRFTLPSVAGLTAATLRIKRDDGAIIYLNGREAGRSSMPGGVATGATPGENASDDGQNFNDVPLNLALLRTGVNVFAIEVHQASGTSSDVSFDLELGLSRAGGGGGGELPVLTQNTILKARAKDGSQWSALNEAFFQVGPDALAPGDVVVSELNFNPPGDDGTEFVELANLSPRAVNLRGARFTEGIHFIFPENRDTLLAPGRRLVLVGDLFAFQQRYGTDVPVAGIFRGNLSNGGERITFATVSSNVLSSVRYDGAKPWPTGADGGGYSLVLSHPQLGLDNPLAWRTSATTNATPGGTDASVFAGDPLADGDGDGLLALFEYALGASDADPANGPSSITYELAADGLFTVTFPRNLRADDVRLRAEVSRDLSGWQPASLVATRTKDDGTASETWAVASQDAPARFLRVVVSRP